MHACMVNSQYNTRTLTKRKREAITTFPSNVSSISILHLDRTSLALGLVPYSSLFVFPLSLAPRLLFLLLVLVVSPKDPFGRCHVSLCFACIYATCACCRPITSQQWSSALFIIIFGIFGSSTWLPSSSIHGALFFLSLLFSLT